MSHRTEKYRVTLNTPGTGIIECGQLIVKESHGNTTGVGFKYSTEYLSNKNAFSIDPLALPLRETAFQFNVNNSIPGFLDDYLPDRWGRKVLTRIATSSQKVNFNANSVIDILSLVSSCNIGAITIEQHDKEPLFDLGLDYRELSNVEFASHIIDNENYKDKIQFEASKLIHLWRDGSGGVGGARPKSLIVKNNEAYLAKFNSTQDKFNNARVELACLMMAQNAGIKIGSGELIENINSRDLLFLKRFDVTNNNQNRKHLITANSLLKNKSTFVDLGQSFRYDNIQELLKIHSTNIANDLEQLLLQMLFNRAINNTDDHERNFSLINDGTGYRLSPAYDLVPSLTMGQYHCAGFQFSTNPLKPSEVNGLSRILGVPKMQAKRCAERVIESVSQWDYFADKASVNAKDTANIKAVFNL